MQDTVLRSVVNGVYVLTAQSQGQVNGCTVAWVTPVSYDPLLIMVSLSSLRFSHDMVKHSGYFGLNTLGRDQVELARHFAFTTGRETNKMEGIPFNTSDHGLPVLDDAKAFIECRLVDVYPAGDHSLFVGEVVSAKSMKDGAETLIFKQEDYF